MRPPTSRALRSWRRRAATMLVAAAAMVAPVPPAAAKHTLVLTSMARSVRPLRIISCASCKSERDRRHRLAHEHARWPRYVHGRADKPGRPSRVQAFMHFRPAVRLM
jgi:hypothetical protein